MNISPVHISQPQLPASKPAPATTDRDGDHDGSAAATDAAEAGRSAALTAAGIGRSVNTSA